MDFQGTILATIPNPDFIIEKTKSAIEATRMAGGAVAFVRVAFEPGELAAFPAHSAMGQRMNALGEAVLAEAPGTQIDQRLSPQPDDISVRKSRVGPFSTTDLDQQLRRRNIDTLLVCGIHTSGCVLTTVRDGHDLDYRLIVISDCCADPDPSMHEFLVAKILPKQAEVVALNDVLGALEETA